MNPGLPLPSEFDALPVGARFSGSSVHQRCPGARLFCFKYALAACWDQYGRTLYPSDEHRRSAGDLTPAELELEEWTERFRVRNKWGRAAPFD